jgi:hypothetical protein
VADAFGTGLVAAVVLGYLARPAGEVVGDDFVGLLLVGLLIGASWRGSWAPGSGGPRCGPSSRAPGSRPGSPPALCSPPG